MTTENHSNQNTDILSNNEMQWEIETIPNEEAGSFLYEKLGAASPLFEQYVSTFARELVSEYDGGFWNLRTLPNGAFFYDLEEKGEIEVIWCDNYFRGTMSVQAMSIAASYFALIRLAEQSENDAVIRQLMYLREYATHIHSESNKLIQLFD